MAGNRVTVTGTHTVHVNLPPEAVYDYTQDYSTRSVWDPSITEVEVLSQSPRSYRLKIKGIGRFTIEYRLDRRGDRTSAAFTKVDAAFFSGGGGSWTYVAADGGTDWSATNTFELKHRLLGRALAPFVRRQMLASMRKSMANAQEIMESAAPAAPQAASSSYWDSTRILSESKVTSSPPE
jgi:hypothetical protein